jgi:hypothetical protein
MENAVLIAANENEQQAWDWGTLCDFGFTAHLNCRDDFGREPLFLTTRHGNSLLTIFWSVTWNSAPRQGALGLCTT